MYLMIDNYDSFTAMLASYFAELGTAMVVKKNDEISLHDIAQMDAQNPLEGIVISPGPKSPADCGSCIQIVRWAAGRHIPLLGVCLGHQVLAAAFGARIVRGKRPMHGKVTPIRTNGKGLFRGIPAQFPVTRYHSLVVDERSLPSCLVVDAHSDDGAVMALRHANLPLFGVQFHPEAARTLYGHELIANFMKA
ncbi:aminodeoxychorismate/anthranilate synthase component II [uncultured Senegalimassilia sp.]|uniref:anthranilate synthase component II n=1 Tax=uncultured Senegalimassilia sp. TaxID=1714350 RepID=UPI002631A0F3|nr:aminodeoxychorismate/anthranilate synthase component II [uncultured Senegalimassilia sp.]